jgi:hypothetical protein
MIKEILGYISPPAFGAENGSNSGQIGQKEIHSPVG